MNARLNSWGVPAASFALAALLSVIGAAEGRAPARAAAAATGACVSDLKNLKVDTEIVGNKIDAKSVHEWKGGIPAGNTITWFYNTADVILTVVHTPKPKKGAAPPAPRTLLLPSKMTPKPESSDQLAVGVQEFKDIKAEFSTNHNRLDAAVNAAKGKLGGGTVTETPNSRTPLVIRVAVKSVTTDQFGPTKCEDIIALSVPTETTLLGGTGTGFTAD